MENDRGVDGGVTVEWQRSGPEERQWDFYAGEAGRAGARHHLGRTAKRERVMAMASARGMGLHSWPGPQVSEK